MSSLSNIEDLLDDFSEGSDLPPPSFSGQSAGNLGSGKRPLEQPNKESGNSSKRTKYVVHKQYSSPSRAARGVSTRRGTAPSTRQQTASGEPPMANEDYCNACGGKGHFLCCDGCPRSFHFSCLEPPLDINQIPEDLWFCKVCCTTRGDVDETPSDNGIFAPMINALDRQNPTVFSIPEDIRTYFSQVSTGPSGEYVDLKEYKPPKAKRFTGPEERDPFKGKDKNNRRPLCYRCGEASSIARGRKIIACDFCDQHWHLDCLDPPRTVLPPSTRKWMCPVHVDNLLPPQRIPRDQKPLRGRRGRPNNGHIDVIPKTRARSSSPDYEELTMNGLRYQVPEETIILDFWDRLHSKRRKFDPAKHSRTRANLASDESSDLSSISTVDSTPSRNIDDLSQISYGILDDAEKDSTAADALLSLKNALVETVILDDSRLLNVQHAQQPEIVESSSFIVTDKETEEKGSNTAHESQRTDRKAQEDAEMVLSNVTEQNYDEITQEKEHISPIVVQKSDKVGFEDAETNQENSKVTATPLADNVINNFNITPNGETPSQPVKRKRGRPPKVKKVSEVPSNQVTSFESPINGGVNMSTPIISDSKKRTPINKLTLKNDTDPPSPSSSKLTLSMSSSRNKGVESPGRRIRRRSKVSTYREMPSSPDESRHESSSVGDSFSQQTASFTPNTQADDSVNKMNDNTPSKAPVKLKLKLNLSGFSNQTKKDNYNHPIGANGVQDNRTSSYHPN